MVVSNSGPIIWLSQVGQRGIDADVRRVLDTMRARGFRLSERVYEDILRRLAADSP